MTRALNINITKGEGDVPKRALNVKAFGDIGGSEGSEIFVIEYSVDWTRNQALELITPIEDVLTAFNNHVPAIACQTNIPYGGYSYTFCEWIPNGGNDIGNWNFGLQVSGQDKSVHTDNYTLSNDGTITKSTTTQGTLN